MRAVLPTHMMARNCLSFIQTGAPILLDNGLYYKLYYDIVHITNKMKNFGEGRLFFFFSKNNRPPLRIIFCFNSCIDDGDQPTFT